MIILTKIIKKIIFYLTNQYLSLNLHKVFKDEKLFNNNTRTTSTTST